ncbi:KR domain-containing protein [Myceligenerans indicum]|uniref:KR domain-containing protein n=1 Tax=Myceligenerans indicum TaxID=2593663 RepID=A0ABS1LNV2_9MICO|nr:KR domain-containing protein [Myceligenerans indicum]MBL0887463.1 KR domain-containing protein [Myceligenerans indicum]
MGSEMCIRDSPVAPAPAAPAAAPAAAAPAPAPAAPAPAAPAADEPPQDVEALVFAVVADKTGYGADILELDMGIEADLGIDSIKRVEILGTLGEKFPGQAPFSPEEVAELRTLGHLVEALQQRSSGRESSPSPSAAKTSADDEESAIRVGRAPVRRVRIAPADIPLEREIRRVTVAGTPGPLTEAVAAALTAAGHDVVADDQADDADLILVLEPADNAAEALAAALVRIGRTVRTAGDDPEHTPRILAVGAVDTREPFAAGGLAPAGLTGIVRTLRIEHPAVRARAVLVDAEQGPAQAERVVAEFDDPADGLDTVVLDDDGRLVPRAAPENTVGTSGDRATWDQLTDTDTVLVSGGARGITARCVQALAERNPAPEYVLLGRSELVDEPEWAREAEDEPALRGAATAHLRAQGATPKPQEVARLARQVLAAREIREGVAAVGRLGARARYVAVDLTDADATRTALEPWAATTAAIVHGAGALADKLVVDKTVEQARGVIATKLAGLEHLLAALPDPARLRHLVLFASVAGLFGNRGQSDYAAANTVLDRWAEAFADAVPGAQAVAIDWGAWDGGMVSDGLREMFAARGYPLVGQDQGAALFREQFDARRAGQQQVLLGPLQPLSEAGHGPRAFAASAPVATLMDSEMVAEHRIGGRRTLPTAVAAGLLLGAVERHTGSDACELLDLRVAAGISEDDRDLGWTVALDPEPTGDLRVRVASLGDGPGGAPRPRFLATVRPGAPVPVSAPLPEAFGADAKPLDGPGPLFHGATLNGIEGIHLGDGEIVVTGHRPSLPGPRAATTAALDPVALDVVLQAALVAAAVGDGEMTLPSAADAVRCFGQVAEGAEVAVRVDRLVAADGGLRVRAVGATREAGGPWRVFAEIDGLRLTARPDSGGANPGKADG